jgi:hypothetical protein
MSWIFGIIGNSIPEELLQMMRSSCDTPLYSIQRNNDLFIVAGGSGETLHCIDNENNCAIVAGCGIISNGTSSRILETHDWQSLTDQTTPSFAALNGNFTVIRYRDKILECYSDKVGLRTLYFGKLNNYWIFSSRLSLVCRFIPESKINWNVFGSRWISFHPLSHNSQIVGVDRLPPNGYIKIEKEIFSKISAPWLSTGKQNSSVAESQRILFALTKIENKHIRIGLSGGLDSRTLLATVSSQSVNFSTYTFGKDDEPDVVLAKKIAHSENISFQNFYSEFPTAHECISLLHQYVHQTNLVGSASMSIRLRYYPLMKYSNAVQIDGGNGEIARRQFLNRLYVFAYNDILHLHSKNIFSHFLLHRADIFNEETNRIMMSGAMNELDSFIHSLPSPVEIGVDNFLDHWAATVLIPNIACDEQARIDEYVLNYMPFSQPDFINSILRIPPNERKSNRFFKKIIADVRPSLSKFPLVKNNIQYPYQLSTLQMRVWLKIQPFFGNTFVDQTPFLFLETIKDYILDILHSQSVKEYSHYNFKKISSSVERYYKGQKHLAGEVNWWIAFEVWRQSVENNKAG